MPRQTNTSTKPRPRTAAAIRQQARMSLGALIEPDDVHNPAAYPPAVRKVRQAMFEGTMPGIDGERIVKGLKEACREETRVPYEHAASLGQDPLLNLTPILEQADAQITELERAIEEVEEHRLELGVKQKKKWLRILKRLMKVRQLARNDAAIYWLYVGKDDDPQRAGQMIHYAQCHIRMFAIWNDDDSPHSLIEAPVGHGKSTCMRGQITWEIGQCPEFRHMYMTESNKLAGQTLKSVRRIISSPRFSALFPEVAILDRNQKAEDSSRAFTIGRLNDFAKDPTFVAVGYLGTIQGSRFDRVWIDDMCSEDVRRRPGIRHNCNEIWNGLVRTRLADALYSRIRVIGTPWHEDDVLGNIVRSVTKGDLVGWRVEIDEFRIKIDKKTDMPIPIWPQKFDAKTLQGLRNSLSSWMYTHELRFDASVTRILTRVHFYNSRPTFADPQWMHEKLEEINQAERWLSIDPAGGGHAWSSGQGVVEYIISPNGYVFIPDCYFWRCAPMELLDKLVDVIYDPSLPRKTKFTGTLWEVEGAVKVAFPALEYRFKQMLEEKGVTGMTFVRTGTKMAGGKQNLSKRARFENAAPYINNGAVRFAGESYGMGGKTTRAIPGGRIARLTELLVNWDGEKKGSDAVDATSQWILNNIHRIASPTAIAKTAVSEQPARKHSANHIQRSNLLQQSLNRMVKDEPMEREQEFLGQLHQKALAGVA